jgi:hypothetical protein
VKLTDLLLKLGKDRNLLLDHLLKPRSFPLGNLELHVVPYVKWTPKLSQLEPENVPREGETGSTDSRANSEADLKSKSFDLRHCLSTAPFFFGPGGLSRQALPNQTAQATGSASTIAVEGKRGEKKQVHIVPLEEQSGGRLSPGRSS